MFKCNFCNRECITKASHTQHVKYCKRNPNKIDHKLKGRPWIGVPQSEETKAKLSVIAKERNLGGRVNGSGRGKKGTYKGYFCDSSWELAWVIYQLDHGIPFKRNNQKFPYEFNGTKFWFPDFVLPDGTYVEIKGYDNEQNKAKRRDFTKPLIVLFEKDLKPIFKYVIGKYGKEYVSLYE